jgi:hypothetical protein
VISTDAAAAQGLHGLQGLFAAHGLQGLQGFLAAHGLPAAVLAAAHGLQALAGVHGAHGFFAAQGLHAAADFTRGTKQRVLALVAAPAAQGLHGLHAAFAAQGLQGLQGFLAAHGLQGLQGFLAAHGLHGAFAAQGLLWATMVGWLEVWPAAKAAALTATPIAMGTIAAVDSSLIRNSRMVCFLLARKTSLTGRSGGSFVVFLGIDTSVRARVQVVTSFQLVVIAA